MPWGRGFDYCHSLQPHDNCTKCWNAQAAGRCLLMLSIWEACCRHAGWHGRLAHVYLAIVLYVGQLIHSTPLALSFSGVRLMHFTPSRVFAVLAATCLTRITANAVNISLSHVCAEASNPLLLWLHYSTFTLPFRFLSHMLPPHTSCLRRVTSTCLSSSFCAHVAHASYIAVHELELHVSLQTKGMSTLVTVAT